MDPFSALLAAITLATAVKDMVELADKIRESFDKVALSITFYHIFFASNSWLSTATICRFRIISATREFLPMILGTRYMSSGIFVNSTMRYWTTIRSWNEPYWNWLSESFLTSGKSLLNLEMIPRKLTQFYSNTVPLIPSPNPRFRERVEAWKNNRIEASIQELKEDVKKCREDFVVREDIICINTLILTLCRWWASPEFLSRRRRCTNQRTRTSNAFSKRCLIYCSQTIQRHLSCHTCGYPPSRSLSKPPTKTLLPSCKPRLRLPCRCGKPPRLAKTKNFRPGTCISRNKSTAFPNHSVAWLLSKQRTIASRLKNTQAHLRP